VKFRNLIPLFTLAASLCVGAREIDVEDPLWAAKEKLKPREIESIEQSDLEEKPFVAIVASYNNQQWYHLNLESLLMQKYDHFRVIYINDCSPDHTGELVEHFLKEKGIDYRIIHFDESAYATIEECAKAFSRCVNEEKHFFTLVNNMNRYGALENYYRGIHSCLDKEIVVTVDGDDWLSDDQVLGRLNRVYSSGEIWFTHGCLIEFPWGNITWSEPIPLPLINRNAAREYKCPSHLRTFYAWLFKRIQLEDLLINGKFFPMTWDMAFMFPLAEMSGGRHAYLSQPNYIYNMSNQLNDNKVDPGLQNQLDRLIRHKIPYSQLKEGAVQQWESLPFDQVVIYGHKLHTHTHSYIHHAFYRTFTHLGFPTFWFDNSDDVSSFDFSRTLFVTEGSADEGIPLRKDSLYMIHNIASDKYNDLDRKNWICFQVYTDDILSNSNLIKIEPCIYYDLPAQCLYMPWATDLLPYEIEEAKINKVGVEKKIYWVGTVGEGLYGNLSVLQPLIKACEENGIEFVSLHGVSREENQNRIRSSFLAPAIVGEWQLEKGYIPCRIFKNISYGKLGVTNSKRVAELFEGKIVYNPDPYQLFYDAKQRQEMLTQKELFEQMDFVKEKHTYVSRIETMLSFFKLVRQ